MGELHFGVIFIADDSEAVNASYHMLGWDDSYKPGQATLLYSSSHEDGKLFICENDVSPYIPLPPTSPGDFLLLYTTPQLAMSGNFRLFLIGEQFKLGWISPARKESINVGDGNRVSLKIIGQVGEAVGMTWIWMEGGGKSERNDTTCTVGKDGTVTMELLWTEDDLFNSVNCND